MHITNPVSFHHNHPLPPKTLVDNNPPMAPSLVGPPMVDSSAGPKSSLNPRKGYTENNSATFLATGNPCLDFFFHVVPDTSSRKLIKHLKNAWNHDPLTTLKLICNLRGVRGTGKSDKEGYYTAALWLHKHHPKTLACNVGPMAEFGYFKDLPEILYRLLEGSDVREKQKKEWLNRKNETGEEGKRQQRSFSIAIDGKKRKKSYNNSNTRSKRARNVVYETQKASNYSSKKSEEARNLVAKKKAEIEEARNLLAKKNSEMEKLNASILKEEKKMAMAKNAVERYSRDPDYKFLYERVSDFFADCLKKDIELLESEKFKGISLAAKWCPSLDSSYDKSTLLCESVARKVFPKESYPEYEGIEDAHYAYRVRDRFRKEVLVPLRKVLELPEVYIGANQWGFIPYNRVASVAMKFYKEKFLIHDEERFEEYMEKVKSGKATIAAGALLPHEIIESLNDSDGGQVAELQWKRMVDDLSKMGKLKNCIAVSDVSSSMNGLPMEVSVALGVLVSELAEEPWKGKVICFSKNPNLNIVEGEDLRSKIEFVRHMDWGGNTDFQKVFDLILEVAVNGNLNADDMIKRIIVFSDMEFDEASANPWETDYEAIKRKFKKKGYGSCVPEIVFWNLRDSKATPVTGVEPGVALVSGFSKNLLKLFLEENGVMNPEIVMEAAIAGEEYKKLVVLD